MPTLSYLSCSSRGAVLAVCCALWGCEQNAAPRGEGEAGPPPIDGSTTTADVSPCNPVLASDYDQSCVVDSDCVAVGEAAQCPPTGCECPTAAVNKSVAARYQAALSLAFERGSTGPACSCACESGGLCRGGKCQVSFCSPPLADTLGACGNLGGRCAYSFNTTCNGMGPSGSCAYSDEFCCLSAPYDAGPDAGVCTAALDTFDCTATYPTMLSSACRGSFGSVTTASCGSLAAIVHGAPPWAFCLYEGVDAGALVGAQRISDVPEMCGGTSHTITGGEVPDSCYGQILNQTDPLPDGSTSVRCGVDAGPQDAAGQ